MSLRPTRMRTSLQSLFRLTSLAVFFMPACASDESDHHDTSGGRGNGVNSGGSSSAGEGRGGSSSGGAQSGGAGSGGAANGGTGSGGRASGGAANGGATSGGTGSGGRASGGATSGGTANGALGGRTGRGGATSVGGGVAASGGKVASSSGGSTGSESCAQPVFTTSDHNGGFSDGGYYVHNNMWNSDATLGPETLYACSYRNWYVVSKQTNEAGAVKTYPNVHKDYHDVPIESFETITSTFAATSPHVGIYNVAYDIWTNGVATSGSTEFMIWTENFNQVPAGNKVSSATFGDRTYDVWKTSNNHYIAFVPKQPFTSGSLDLLQIFEWTMTQGWLPKDSTLGQICFGVEIVSTDGNEATFQFTDFSIVDD